MARSGGDQQSGGGKRQKHKDLLRISQQACTRITRVALDKSFHRIFFLIYK